MWEFFFCPVHGVFAPVIQYWPVIFPALTGCVYTVRSKFKGK